MRTLICFLALCGAAENAWARGRLVRAEGRVEAGKNPRQLRPVRVGDRLNVGSVIRTGSDGSARLLMDDDSVLNIGPDSELRVRRYQVSEKRRRVSLRLTAGRLWARVTRIFGGRKNFEVETPNAVAGVRGTEFVVDTGGGETTVTVLAGEVSMKGRRGPPVTLLPNGQGRVMQRGRAQQIALDPGVAQSAVSGAGPQGRLSGNDRAERIDSAKQSTEGGRSEGGLRSRPSSPDRQSEPDSGPSEGSAGDGPTRSGGGPENRDAPEDGLRGDGAGERPSGDGSRGGAPGDGVPGGDGSRGDSPGADAPGVGTPGAGTPGGDPGDAPKPRPQVDAPRGDGAAVPGSAGSAGKPSGAPPAPRPPAIQRPVQRPPVTIPGGSIGVNPVDPGTRATRIRLRVRVREP
ncbi:MAG: FecR domain-containing protein [Myxococcota bacterium]